MIYLAADSVAFKMVQLGPLLLPGPPFIFPVTYAIGDILAEVYGFRISRNIIYYTLVIEILYALIVRTIIGFQSPAHWGLENDFINVFGHIIRFVFSGCFSVLASSIINVFLFSKIKVLMNGKMFWFRSVVSSAIGGFVLVFIIIVFGYSAVLNVNQMLHMFISIYILELLYACALIWPAWKISTMLKLVERIDVYDYQLNFTSLFK